MKEAKPGDVQVVDADAIKRERRKAMYAYVGRSEALSREQIEACKEYFLDEQKVFPPGSLGYQVLAENITIWDRELQSLAPSPAAQGDRYDTEGYALAMEVLQSDLYAKLHDKARVECDEFIQRGMAEPAEPVSWVVTGPAGTVLHVSKHDGWNVEVVATVPAPSSEGERLAAEVQLAQTICVDGHVYCLIPLMQRNAVLAALRGAGGA